MTSSSRLTRFSTPPLAFWLFAVALFTTAIAVSGAYLLIDRQLKRDARRDVQEVMRMNAAALRDALDQGMAQHFDQVKVLAELDQVARGRTPQEVQRALDSYQSKFPQYAWLGLADAQGKVFAASGGLLQGVSVSQRDWFQAGMRAPFVGDVHPAKLLATLLPSQEEPWRFVDFAVPVERDGRFIGVLGVHMSWGWAASLKQMLAEQLLQPDTQILVLDGESKVLLGPQDLEGSQVDLHSLNLQADHITTVVETRGHGSYGGLGWKVLLRQPEVVAMAGYRSARNQKALSALALCLLLTPWLFWVARRLARPLNQLTDWMEAGAEIPPNWWAPYREAEVFGKAFSDWREQQAHHTRELAALAVQLEHRVAERTAELADAHQLVDASNARLSAILEHSTDAFVAMDAKGVVTDWNSAAEQLFGYRREVAVGQALSTLIIPPGRRSGHDGGMEHFERTGTGPVLGRRLELNVQHQDGSLLPVEISVSAFKGRTGFVAFGFLRDIRERRAAQAQVAASQRQLRAITDNLPMMISYIDAQERMQFTNQQFEVWTGIPVASALGRPLRDVIGEPMYLQRQQHLAKALGGERVEFEVESVALGTKRWLTTVYVPDVAAGGVVSGVYTLTTDVTALRDAERRMAELAMHDPLTGLPNRRNFTLHLPQVLARSRRNVAATALLFLDVDHFKSVNDRHGHAAGDLVLQAFAHRLRESVRQTDFVARLAGDEFVVVLEGLSGPAEVDLIAGKLVRAVHAAVRLDDASVVVPSASIGAAYAPSGAHLDPEDYLAAADAALYATKARGRNGFTVVDAVDTAGSPGVFQPPSTDALTSACL